MKWKYLFQERHIDNGEIGAFISNFVNMGWIANVTVYAAAYLYIYNNYLIYVVGRTLSILLMVIGVSVMLFAQKVFWTPTQQKYNGKTLFENGPFKEKHEQIMERLNVLSKEIQELKEDRK